MVHHDHGMPGQAGPGLIAIKVYALHSRRFGKILKGIFPAPLQHESSSKFCQSFLRLFIFMFSSSVSEAKRGFAYEISVLLADGSMPMLSRGLADIRSNIT